MRRWKQGGRLAFIPVRSVKLRKWGLAEAVFGKGHVMTPTETVVRCIVWYIAALVLAPLPYLALRSPELAGWCIIGLPSLPRLVFLMHGGPNPLPVILIGYLVQIALAVKAVTSREERIRKTCYLIFRCLIVIDVLVAWFGPILFLLVMHPGE